MIHIQNVLYEYYSRKNRVFPYFKSIFTLTGISMLHLFFVFQIFNLYELLKPLNLYGFRLSINSMILIFSIFLLALFLVVFRKKRFKVRKFSDSQLLKQVRVITIYCSAIFILLMIFTLTSPRF